MTSEDRRVSAFRVDSLTSRRVRCLHVDVFPRTKFSGNPAGVVLGADALDEEELQSIAREFNCSETAFVMDPAGSDHDFRVRFFTPTTGVPGCGRATIAGSYVRSVFSTPCSPSARMLFRAGIVRIETRRSPEVRLFVYMHQLPPRFTDFPKDHEDELLNALGIIRSELEPRCPVTVVSTGHSMVLIGVESAEILDALSPGESG